MRVIVINWYERRKGKVRDVLLKQWRGSRGVDGGRGWVVRTWVVRHRRPSGWPPVCRAAAAAGAGNSYMWWVDRYAPPHVLHAFTQSDAVTCPSYHNR